MRGGERSFTELCKAGPAEKAAGEVAGQEWTRQQMVVDNLLSQTKING